MNQSITRYRSHLARATALALTLEVLLLLPRSAGASSIPSSWVECSNSAKYFVCRPSAQTMGPTLTIQYLFVADRATGQYSFCEERRNRSIVTQAVETTYPKPRGTTLMDVKLKSSYCALQLAPQVVAALKKTQTTAKKTPVDSNSKTSSAKTASAQKASGVSALSAAKAGSPTAAAAASAAAPKVNSSAATAAPGSNDRGQDAALVAAATKMGGTDATWTENSEGGFDVRNGAGQVVGKLSSANSAAGKIWKPSSPKIETHNFNGQTITREYEVNAKGQYVVKAGSEKIVDQDPSAKDNWKVHDDEAEWAEKRKDKASRKQARKEARKAKEDPCEDSAQVNSNWGCRKTDNIVKQAEIVNVAGQTVGAAAVQMIGNSGNQQLANSGRVSDSFDVASKGYKTAAIAQTVVGAANLAYSSLQLARQKKHDQVNAQLKNAENARYRYDNGRVESDHSIQNKIIDRFKLNERNTHNGAVDPHAVQMAAEDKNESIRKEQSAAGDRAYQGMFQSAVNAAGAITQATTAFKQAKEQKKIANDYRTAENRGPVLPNFGVDPAELKRQQQAQQAAASDDGENSGVNSDGSSDEYDPNLLGGGGGLNYGDGDGDPAADDPLNRLPTGPFNAASGGGGGGGALGALGAGSGSSAPAPQQEESKPQFAGTFGGKDKYEGTGAVSRGFGGGSKGGGDSGGGFDMNSLLAKFLPTDEGEKEAPSVLETEFRGSRGLASIQNSAPSVLDASADLFGRIHDLYQQKHARGLIGK